MSILLAGFEPWGRHRRNPSGDVARALGGHVLPVHYGEAGRRIVHLIRRTRPEAVVLLGLAESRKRIALEALALNVDHCEARPWTRWRRPIRKGGPLVRPTRLPVDRLHALLRRRRIPVTLSHHAGTFICNHVFYMALSACRVPCGFVHLPPVSRVPLRTQMRAVRLILERVGKGS